MYEIDTKGMHYKDLNQLIRTRYLAGETEIHLKNVCGHRYIGDGISGNLKIVIEGVPGNDMAAFMNGPEITVRGNAQDATGNTMNEGRIIIHGSAGDTLGYAMRGGEIFVRGDAGYRVGIHMKEYLDKRPSIIIGGKAGDFLGEYMAGGLMIVLGLEDGDCGADGNQYTAENNCGRPVTGRYCGTGMHGGVIYIRGGIEEHMTGREVKAEKADDKDMENIVPYLRRYGDYFGIDMRRIMEKDFYKLTPYNTRPYGNLYAY